MKGYTVCLMFILVVSATDAAQSCPAVRQIFHNHLQINSPNFGSLNSYPPNTNCHWDITLPSSQRAKLSFMTFDLEYIPGCKWDGVEVIRGECSQNGPSLLRHCGIITPAPIIVEGAVCLKFWSDAVGNKMGFLLSIYLLVPATTWPAKFFQTTTESTRSTSAPPLEKKGMNQGRQLFMIPSLGRIPLLTTATALTTNQQGLTSNGDAPKTYNTYQTTTKPPGTTTAAIPDVDDARVPVDFLPACSGSGVVVTDKQGLIQSPNYGSGNYPPEVTCQWTIRCSREERIQLTFTDFAVEWTADCSWDSLTVYTRDTSNTDNIIGRFCGSELPPNITATGSTVVLVFVSDRVTSLSGFQLKYRLLSKKQTECGVLGPQLAAVNYYVFGGTLADARDVPWQASVRRDGQHICGGAVLSPSWIMTAAHCVDMIQLSPFRVTVLVGSSLVSGGSKFTQIRQAAEVITHPTYLYAKSGDLALIRLLKPLSFSDVTLPVCLPEQGHVVPSQTCYIAGWGATGKTDDGEYKMPSAELRKADVHIWPQLTCAAAYPRRISEHMFCAGHKRGQIDSCKGDSGGALICRGESGRWQAEGIISWGGQCGQPGQPGVYTRLRHYATWVRDVINQPDPSIGCSFDVSMCGYHDDSRGSLSWRRRDARFPVAGFSSIRATRGHYIHVDGPIGHAGHPAEFIFPEVVTSSPKCLSFSYAISQTHVTELSLVKRNRRDHQKLWTLIGRHHHDWRNTSVTIQSGVSNLSLVFVTDYFSRDLVAVDNILLSQGPCAESKLQCDFTAGNTCGYSQLKGSQLDWTVSPETTAGGQRNFHLVASGNSESSNSVARLQSPLFYSDIPNCWRIRYTSLGSGGHLNITTATQHGGRTYIGDILLTIAIKSTSSDAVWRTASVDIPASAHARRCVLEYRSDGQSKLMIDNFGSYEGNCISQ